MSLVVHRPAISLFLTASLAVLSGCVTSNPDVEAAAPSHTRLESPITEVDLSPRLPQRVGLDNDRASPRPKASVYYGDEQPVSAEPGVKSHKELDATGSINRSDEKYYALNFEATPVAAAAKAVLGDVLGESYTIDPKVQGSVTLSSSRAVARKDVLFAFESALRVANIALVKDSEGYRLIPAAEAPGSGPVDKSGGPDAGYGLSVVPLQYVSAAALMKLMDNFGAKPGMVRADQTRNLLVIQGTASDRQTAIETAMSFDADWMSGQSIGIYPVVNSTPEPVISELERIIDSGEGGLSQSVVKLQPVARQNGILVVARTPQLLKRVSTWIARLDRSGGEGTGVKVYRMRYGDAKSAAALLNSMFLEASSSGADSPSNQIAPGSGLISSSSERTKLAGAQSSFATTPTAGVSATQNASASPASFNSRFPAGQSPGPGQNSDSVSSSHISVASSGKGGPVLANVRIAADVANNALLIYANQENYSIIKQALQQIDRPQLQVAIDATIAEVSINDTLRYGVQAYLSSSNVGLGKDTGSVVNSAVNTGTNALLNRVLPGFNFLVGTEASPRLVLDALRTVTDVKVLSTPSLVVLDNQFASLQVGDQIPITTRTAQSVDVSATAPVINSIDYRNTGVILRVAPRINANGTVLLRVEQEISSVANTSTANTLTPTVSDRRIESSISVVNGQTVVLGGLMSERRQAERDGVPGIEQVPIVSELFTRREGVTQRTELIIFIRPQIIRNGLDASRIAQELRAKMSGFRSERRPPPPQMIHK